MVTSRAINLGRQLAAIKSALPETQGTVHRGELRCTAVLQPTPASRRYTARLTYRHRRAPRVAIIDPPLALHPGATSLPHVYSSGDLCLYLPGQWKESMLLADTIMPWTQISGGSAACDLVTCRFARYYLCVTVKSLVR